MSLIKSMQDRSGNQCELCASTSNLSIYNVPPNGYGTVDDSVLICETCKMQLENPASIDSNHWR